MTYFEEVTVKVGQRRRKALDAVLRRRSIGRPEVGDTGQRRISVGDGLRPCEPERERERERDKVLL